MTNSNQEAVKTAPDAAWPYPRIVAHRGGGKLAPENTLAALRCGLAHGFHAVEFDVMLSLDQVALLMHDCSFGRTVLRMAEVGADDAEADADNRADHAGNLNQVSSTSAAVLLQMDAGSWFGPQFAGETVPSLQQVLAFCDAQQIWMNIEIKPAPGFEALTGQIVARETRAFYGARLSTMPRAQQPLFSSFSLTALKAAQETAPEIARGVLFERVPPDWLAIVQDLRAVALHTNHQSLNHALAQAVKAAGLGLFCYTVNQPARARQLLEWGVDGFCTDRIDLIGPDFA